MKKDNKKTRLRLYYLSFCIISVARMMKASSLFGFISSELFSYASVAAMILFTVKFLLDGHTQKEIAIVSIISILLIIASFCGLPAYAVLTFLAFISIKDVNVRSIIKMDFAIKVIFFTSHLALYGLDLIFDQTMAATAISEHTKGMANSLYFVNPNITGLIGTWALIECLYLRKKKRKIDYVLLSILAIFVFFLTLSRTSLFIFTLYMLLQVIKNDKVLYVMSKILYPIMLILSFIVISGVFANNELLISIDDLLTGRLSYSISAFNALGVNLFPIVPPDWVIEKYIIDNFYIRCITYYGIITALFYYIPFLLLPRKSSKDSKITSIVVSVFLFSEAGAADISLCPAFLLFADSTLNRKADNEAK